MKYKVGDRVKIRKDLKVGKKYNGLYYEEYMQKNPIVTINSVYYGFYTVCENHYNYTDEMIEGLADTAHTTKAFTKSNLKSGDVIVRKNGAVEIVCLETGTLILKNGFNELSKIEEFLKDLCGREYDIMKVYRPQKPYQCQFDRSCYTDGKLMFNRKNLTEFDRQKWIDEWYQKRLNNINVKFAKVDKTIYVLDKHGKSAFSKCSQNDVYNTETGVAVAYARYCGEPIPEEI